MAGEGHSGHLYVAEQHESRGYSRTIAVKRLHPQLARHPHFRQMFVDAAQIGPQLDHPNVAAVHELGGSEGAHFISMEYLPGESVAAILARCATGSQVPIGLAASIAQQVANALDYGHKLRDASGHPLELAHGSVSPSSIFVTYHGLVKLLDLGLALPDSSGEAAASGPTTADSTSHARAFRAPEQVNGGTADHRSDVFSLGAVLWSCLVGRRLFIGNTDAKVDAAVLSQRIVAPSKLRPDVPQVLDAIVLRALMRDPAERFATAREMSEALDRFVIRHEPRPTPKEMRRFLEDLFDAETAALKKEIAQGRNVRGALEVLLGPQRPSGASGVARRQVSARPRELWSTSSSMFSALERRSSAAPAPHPRSTPAPGEAQRTSSAPPQRAGVSSAPPRRPRSSAPRVRAVAQSTPSPLPPGAATTKLPTQLLASPRTWKIGAAISALALVVLAIVVPLLSPSDNAPLPPQQDARAADQSGQIDVRSEPEGALVFIDGEPTGLRTPVVLKGLDVGRTLKLRVDKAGFQDQEREITIAGNAVETHTFGLVASSGLVRFAGVPPEARVYVDDVELTGGADRPITLAIGRHTVRVETPSSLVFSATVSVVAGEQTIRVDGSEAKR